MNEVPLNRQPQRRCHTAVLGKNIRAGNSNQKDHTLEHSPFSISEGRRKSEQPYEADFVQGRNRSTRRTTSPRSSMKEDEP